MLYFDLCVLLTAHILGDYTLQGDFLGKCKCKNNFIMCIHCYLWTISIIVGLFIIGYKSDILIFGILFISHFIVDKCKANNPDKEKALTTLLYIDQSIHCLIVLLVYILLRGV